jgi:hypothetical protein
MRTASRILALLTLLAACSPEQAPVEVVAGPPVDAPLSLTASDGAGLELVSLTARGVVEEPLAFTQLHLVFRNPESRVREGQFRISLPPGADISRFAMRVGDRWQEGEVVEKQAARRVYEDFLHRRQDPALLEQAGGNEFSARVFPIPAGAEKELIISYSHALVRADAPYVVPLRGLPRMARVDVEVLVGGSPRRETHANWTPDHDFSVVPPSGETRLGLRHQNLVVARVTPVLPHPVEEVESLFILLDTSASRALGFRQQFETVRALVEGLAQGSQGRAHVGLAAFDQTTELVFEGAALDFGEKEAAKVAQRGALGASDVDGALAWLKARMEKAHAYKRVLLVTDGMATLGNVDGDKLRASVRALSARGVERMDVLAVGGVRDQDMMQRLVTSGLSHDGCVIDGKLDANVVAQKLTSATVSGIPVAVEGASWVWPTQLDGVQANDQFLIYADLPPEKPFALTLGGVTMVTEKRVLAPVERPLLERAWVGARMSKLLHQRDVLAAGDKEQREALRMQVIELSTRHRVMSPFTALLVLETERDYQRFNIQRTALTNILGVDDHGVTVLQRTPDSVVYREAAAPLRNVPVPEMVDRTKPPVSEAPQSRSQESLSHAVMKAMVIDDGLLGVLGRAGGGAFVDSGATGGAGGAGSAGGAVGIGGLGGKLGTRSRRMEPNVEAGRSSVQGSLSATMVKRAVEGGMPSIKLCFERALLTQPDLAVNLVVAFNVAPSGRVTRVSFPPATTTDRALMSCVAKAFGHLQFPESRREARVSLPLRMANPWAVPPSPPVEPLPPPPVEESQTLRNWENGVEPFTGRYKMVMDLLAMGDLRNAYNASMAWRMEDPADVVALIALGQVGETANDLPLAERAYGSLIDLFPARADIRRFAGERLERISDEEAQRVAADTFAKAAEQRPDHPAGHRLLAFSLLRAHRYADAFEAIINSLHRSYPFDRFNGADRILREDLGLIAAVWMRAEPSRAAEIRRKLEDAGGTREDKPSLRFVLVWETDANDVDFHILDGEKGHAYFSARTLKSGGSLYADVTTGYGPECFTIRKEPQDRAYPYTLKAHYYSRGPMGYGMGKLQLLEHDGNGNLIMEERPFVVMQDRAYVDLGTVTGTLQGTAVP